MFRLVTSGDGHRLVASPGASAQAETLSASSTIGEVARDVFARGTGLAFAAYPLALGLGSTLLTALLERGISSTALAVGAFATVAGVFPAGAQFLGRVEERQHALHQHRPTDTTSPYT